MYHYIYKIESKSGKYYIGRHSTSNIDDGYMGSGVWVGKCKKQSTPLKKEILRFVDTFEELLEVERVAITENITNDLCMNFHNSSMGFGVGQYNVCHDPLVREKRLKNHWYKTDRGKKWFSDNNPSKRDSVKKMRSEKAKELWQDQEYRNKISGANHYMKNTDQRTRFSKENPMYNEETKEKIRSALKEKAAKGELAIQRPEIRRASALKAKERMLLSNPMKNPLISAKLRKPKERVECPHCNKIGGKPSMKRYHFDNCRKLLSITK